MFKGQCGDLPARDKATNILVYLTCSISPLDYERLKKHLREEEGDLRIRLDWKCRPATKEHNCWRVDPIHKKRSCTALAKNARGAQFAQTTLRASNRDYLQ
jgi:16S rRNA C967 or C1407 C5-methylase (RsmB/RsmF family)